MPSPLSIRPSGSAGRRSSAFVREDSGRASGSALLVDHHCPCIGRRPIADGRPKPVGRFRWARPLARGPWLRLTLAWPMFQQPMDRRANQLLAVATEAQERITEAIARMTASEIEGSGF